MRLERTVSWSQTRRDTNFAIPGYSVFAIIPWRRGEIKVFSVCSHLCGQSRFYAVFRNRKKSRKYRCHKALRRFALPRPGYRHGIPKPGAIPTSLYPDIQFFPLYHGGEENQRFFCLWSFVWSKPLLYRFQQSREIPQTHVSQGFAAFYLALPDTATALPNQAHHQLCHNQISIYYSTAYRILQVLCSHKKRAAVFSLAARFSFIHISA